MISQWLTALQQAGLLLSDPQQGGVSEAQSLLHDEDLADALWLAAHMGVEALPPAGPEAAAADSPSVTTLAGDSRELPAPAVAVYLPNPAERADPNPADAYPDQGLPLQVQAAPALPNPRQIERSFRPLRRRVASRTQTVLDELATVDRIAEHDLWVPVLKAAPERWFDLELVIEASPFSFIWASTLTEFRQLLERQGAFGTVRTWWVTEAAGQPALTATSPHSADPATTPARSPRELVAATGRRLVLYVSDCRSALWQRGTIHPWLGLWGEHGPAAIVQLLPERLWAETELDVGDKVQVSALTPGLPNPQLYSLPPAPLADHTLTIPVVTLTAGALKQWALVVAGAGGQRLPARRFDLDWVLAPERQADPAVIIPQSPAATVELFVANASPIAQTLARIMAALPVSLPVVHLIQKHLLPEATPVHVAEVYSSGLMIALPTPPSATQPTYDFAPGVRDQLVDATPIDATLNVLDVLSKAIANSLGFKVNSFTALLSPQVSWGDQTKAALLPFAQVATRVLHRLGGDYAALARQVEQDAAQYPGWITPVDDPSTPDPAINTLTFKTARFVDNQPEAPAPDPNLLEPFDITVATLVQAKRQWVVQRQPQQAYRYIEPLTPDLPLEMVAIPGGTFLMGSPKGEPERYDDESPQHEVTVEPFFIGRYPITQAQWRFVAGLPQVQQALAPDPSNFKGDNHPVESVSWYDAVEFCARLSAHTGRAYRLPTEAEWEYACRAGTTTPFHFGEMITTDVANYDGNYTYNNGPKGEYREATTPVDQLAYANAWGLSDMHGNVWEWCQDHWHENYEGAPPDGRAWLSEDEDARRVLRGGSWILNPRYCRSAYRNVNYPREANGDFGFRVVSFAPRTL